MASSVVSDQMPGLLFFCSDIPVQIRKGNMVNPICTVVQYLNRCIAALEIMSLQTAMRLSFQNIIHPNCNMSFANAEREYYK